MCHLLRALQVGCELGVSNFGVNQKLSPGGSKDPLTWSLLLPHLFSGRTQRPNVLRTLGLVANASQDLIVGHRPQIQGSKLL